MSFMNQALKGVPQDHYRQLLESCQKIGSEDVLTAMRKYLLPIFHSESSIAFVVSSPGKADEIQEVSRNDLQMTTSFITPQSLGAIGFEVEKRKMEGAEGEVGSEGGSGSDS